MTAKTKAFTLRQQETKDALSVLRRWQRAFAKDPSASHYRAVEVAMQAFQDCFYGRFPPNVGRVTCLCGSAKHTPVAAYGGACCPVRLKADCTF